MLSTMGCGIALAQTTATYSYVGPSLPIYYTSADTGTLMNINVPAPILITTVTANISVNYPYTGDLNVFLFGPDGTRTILTERNCNGSSTLVNITFADSGASMYSSVCPATSGGAPYRGNQPLSNYTGKTSNGTWSLFVENNGSNTRFGTVDAFSLTITGTPLAPPTITSIANAVGQVSPGAISPGEVIGVSGTNIGPSPAVISTSATLPATLGGVQLAVNGQAVPLYYVSANLVAGVIPYQAIPGNPAVIGGQVTITLTYNGVASNPVIVNLTSSTPALFTSGSGVSNTVTVSAINQNGTVNSTSNRAPVGSYVALYASGLGAVTPSGFQAGTTTALPPPYFNVAAPTYVSISGQAAPVSFAGLAPSLIAAYQVNIQIPPGTPSGAQPISLFNSVGLSQSPVYIWIQ